jgi:hypothetical protein
VNERAKPKRWRMGVTTCSQWCTHPDCVALRAMQREIEDRLMRRNAEIARSVAEAVWWAT